MFPLGPLVAESKPIASEDRSHFLYIRVGQEEPLFGARKGIQCGTVHRRQTCAVSDTRLSEMTMRHRRRVGDEP